jgi:hypothetical protein
VIWQVSLECLEELFLNRLWDAGIEHATVCGISRDSDDDHEEDLSRTSGILHLIAREDRTTMCVQRQ